MNAFQQKYEFGEAGESLIARWMRKKYGRWVMPVYEKVINTGKGPQLYLPNDKRLIAPDLFVFDMAKALWVEAKRKSRFSYHRLSERWVTGIDLVHYADYKKVDALSPWPVWLLFLHEKSDDGCPHGLFGGSLEYLKDNENHRHTNWGNGGMVYWHHAKLRQLATIEEVKGA